MCSIKARIRQLHRFLAPIMLLPVLLTLVTGSLFQIADLTGQEEAYDRLLDLHEGEFGVNLAGIYPFFNVLGLLTLAIAGISMYSGGSSRRRTLNN